MLCVVWLRVQVNVGSVDLSASRSVKQTVEVIEDRDRERRLRQLLNKYHKNNNRVLVFVLYKKEVTKCKQRQRLVGVASSTCRGSTMSGFLAGNSYGEHHQTLGLHCRRHPR